MKKLILLIIELLKESSKKVEQKNTYVGNGKNSYSH